MSAPGGQAPAPSSSTSTQPAKKKAKTSSSEAAGGLMTQLLQKTETLGAAAMEMSRAEEAEKAERRAEAERAVVGEDVAEFVRQGIGAARREALNERARCSQDGRKSALSLFEVEARLGLVCEKHGAVGDAESVPKRAVFSKRGCGAKPLEEGEEVFVSGVSATAAATASETIERIATSLRQRSASAQPQQQQQQQQQPTTKTTTESTFGSDDAALKDVRLVVAENGATRFERKKTVSSLTAAFPSAKFDVRISASTETPLATLPDERSGASQKIWHAHRLKRRVSTTYRYWRIDETSVRTTAYVGLTTEQAKAVAFNSGSDVSRNGGGTNDAEQPQKSAAVPLETREIELELDARYVDGWLSTNDDEPLVQELVALLSRLNPLEGVDTRFDPSVEPTDKDLGTLAARQLRASLPRLYGDHSGTAGVALRFPGSMPVGFCRRHLSFVQRPDDYACAEKSDGERRLLLVFEVDVGGHKRKAAALVDRSLKYRLVRLTKAALDAMPAGVVLDGEIVFNLDQRVPVFLVFDVLHDGKQDVTDKSFDHRYFGTLSHLTGPLRGALCALCPSAINDEAAGNAAQFKDIVAAERDAARRRTEDPPAAEEDAAGAVDPTALKEAPTVFLVPKRFARPKDAAAKVLKMMTRDDDVRGLVAYGSRVFSDGPAKLHLTDGLIFVPRKAPYAMGSDDKLFKWKWPSGLTVDLQVRGEGRGGDLSLYATGDDGDVVDCSKHVVLPEHDEARLRADVSHYSGTRSGLVVELGLDAASGLWEYHGPRPDKDSGNHFDVFVSTLLLHAESPDQPELEYRIKVTDPSRDDWPRLYQAALTRATTPWREHFSAKSQRLYYFNKDTGETTWDKPRDLVLGLDG